MPAAVAETVLASFPESAGPAPSGTGDTLAGMFVRSIAVSGFRGIGPQARLPIQPSLGLTLVVGRNGCGKSSFAEAAEFAITGDNKRWANKSKIWKDGWRNLHEGTTPYIAVELQTECPDNPLTISGSWGPGTALEAGQWTAQRKAGDARPLDRSRLAQPLQLYRPFLSYSELGSLIDGTPSSMYDALHSLLGLDDLTTALATLQRRRLDLDKAIKETKRGKETLLAELSILEDERARTVERQLQARQVDLEALSRVVLGAEESSGAAAWLSAVTAVELPSEEAVEAALTRLTAATTRLLGVATADAEASSRMLDILILASEFAEDGDCRCPVCGEGELDEQWRDSTRQTISDIRTRTIELAEANKEQEAASAHVRELIRPLPASLSNCPIDSAAAVLAWRQWAELAGGEPTALPSQMPARHRRARAELAALQARARTELARLDDVWAPLARQIAAWVEMATTCAGAPDELKTVKAAENWLKNAAGTLRNERMRPLTELSQRVWTTLRQQSNVELGDVVLEGTAQTRRVNLDVTVDGVAGAALGVMSQGELHALGLSLFLPRATAEQSPFRFLMIDDPVQSMDPAKVDGLARVLADVACTRQVIVFTHDLRLPEAVRRLQIPATVLDVQRRERSVVEVRVSIDPVRRYIDDARALSLTRNLPRAEADEMIALCCRLAIESAATTKVRRVLGEHGFRQSDITEQLERAERTVQKLALAVFYDRTRESDVLAHLDKELAPWASEVVRTCNSGAHGCTREELGDLVNRAERIAKWINR
ncbi:AAA family ATPase [Nocardia cyriacigeorgica]|uniref:AAA family ATPase n=1 Tax=Nocardia cyriacigeorgica TaxID=135487 RepID=UPI001894C2D3|nr:AAA family ATPase [Nocardia cyriacigeorgica]MBF6318120.1 AAA family ATPase [Nocardia cyriacigeorgica]MBF6516776.1 AAA family ATPase [Nocardia cyriacigeorgica]MBF6532900.1 AAA family ATPase [Nocardia cyriacigeorgica]